MLNDWRRPQGAPLSTSSLGPAPGASSGQAAGGRRHAALGVVGVGQAPNSVTQGEVDNWTSTGTSRAPACTSTGKSATTASRKLWAQHISNASFTGTSAVRTRRPAVPVRGRAAAVCLVAAGRGRLRSTARMRPQALLCMLLTRDDEAVFTVSSHAEKAKANVAR